MIAKLAAFLRRDFRIALSYRVSFAQGMVALFFSLVTMNFVGRLVDEGEPSALEPYGNDYFGYVLIGVASLLFAQAVAGQFTSAVRGAQVTGTLEAMMITRTSSSVFLVGSSLYGLAFAAVRLLVALLVGALLLGADLQAGGALLAVAAFALTMAAFAGVGIFAAAFVLRFKQPEPITPGLITVSALVSGVLYPTSVLPHWLEALSPLMPLTHTMSALRDALLGNASFAAVGDDLAVLAGFALLLPAGLAAFEIALRSAKRAGSLSHY